MVKILYYASKLLKKLRLSAIKNSDIHKSSKHASGCHFVNCSIDKYTDIGYDCQFLYTSIGSFCSIGSNVWIGGGSHPIEWVSTSAVFTSNIDAIKTKFAFNDYNPFKKTFVGNDVWIGDNVLIKSGICIGDGAIIGMGSVVTKDVPPYTIVVGNPAKAIRTRFDQDTVEKLLRIKWWNFSDKKIRQYSNNFNDVRKFLNAIGSEEIEGE